MIRLVKLSHEYRPQLEDMMSEWSATGEKIIPWVLKKNDWKNFDCYLKDLETTPDIADSQGLVPDSTFFALDVERNIFVGAVNIRHQLNEYLLLHGGHIGDGVRPSERNRGYGTQMIRLALEECKKLGIYRVLMVCDKANVASAKTIIKNGGMLENEISDGKCNIEQRYWITLH